MSYSQVVRYIFHYDGTFRTLKSMTTWNYLINTDLINFLILMKHNEDNEKLLQMNKGFCIQKEAINKFHARA